MLAMYLAGAALSFGFSLAATLFDKDRPEEGPWSVLVVSAIFSWFSFGFFLAALLMDIRDKLIK